MAMILQLIARMTETLILSSKAKAVQNKGIWEYFIR